MLQQTQVTTVIPYFLRFIERFPTIHALAGADEQTVLRMWQGLGYYSRARNLLKAARTIVAEHGGEIPRDVATLLSLPGVGRYTAGAIASIAFGTRTPILDGNVARVICRLGRIESDPRERETVQLLWRRAEELLPRKRAGDFNQAMMELGALVCTPRNPQCLICPLRDRCRAFQDGVQDRIPLRRATRVSPLLQRWTICIEHARKFLIEQRPPKGRWAGMWQFVTIEPNATSPDAHLVQTNLALDCGELLRIGAIEHTLTHRRYKFEVFRCAIERKARSSASDARKWVRLDELTNFPLAGPHVKIAKLLARENAATSYSPAPISRPSTTPQTAARRAGTSPARPALR